MVPNLEWFALQTRRNYEISVRVALLYKGYDVLLPLYRSLVGNIRGSMDANSPLYPGYVFCRLNTEATGKIVTTPGVLRIVGYGKRPQSIPQDEIDIVLRTADSDLPVRPWKYFPVNSSVMIESGPMRGFVGTLVSTDRTEYFVVALAFLNRMVAVTLPESTQVRCLSSGAAPTPLPQPCLKAFRGGAGVS